MGQEGPRSPTLGDPPSPPTSLPASHPPVVDAQISVRAVDVKMNSDEIDGTDF